MKENSSSAVSKRERDTEAKGPSNCSELQILEHSLLWLLATLVFYSFFRLQFLLWNWSVWFHTTPHTDLIKAFLEGLRFDLSSLIWLSSLVLIGALLPWPASPLRLKELTLKTTFLLIHIPFLLFNGADIDLIHFAGRRMTPDSFYLLRETQGKFLALIQTYWPLFIVNIPLLWLYGRFIARLNLSTWQSQWFSSGREKIHSLFLRWHGRMGISLLLLILLTLGARGGLQIKPLELTHATAISSDVRLVHLTLNSSFTMIHSLKRKRMNRLNYFASREELLPLLNASTPGELLYPWDRKPRNVVLFILESFGTEYTGLDDIKDKTSYTPFLDSLRPHSLFFTQSFANGRRSIEALPSLLAGLPSLMDEPFLTSPYQTLPLPQLGNLLADQGIWSVFFHGGANGTMFFQEFTQRLGFSQYFGRNEYPEAHRDHDGTWGIWDGPFLKHFGQHLSKKDSAFFAVFFSLSSHHPFKVPQAYAQTLPSGPLPILQTIAYTDQMLKGFFEEFQSAPWFKDTLFIFTADHTSKSYHEEYQSVLGGFRVPLFLYFPGSALNENIQRLDLDEPIQHIDVLPTLYDLFSIPRDSQTPRLGRSLFQSGPRRVTLYLDNHQFLVEKNSTLSLSTEAPSSSLMTEPTPSVSIWKAHRQYFINGLLDNQW